MRTPKTLVGAPTVKGTRRKTRAAGVYTKPREVAQDVQEALQAVEALLAMLPGTALPYKLTTWSMGDGQEHVVEVDGAFRDQVIAAGALVGLAEHLARKLPSAMKLIHVQFSQAWKPAFDLKEHVRIRFSDFVRPRDIRADLVFALKWRGPSEWAGVRRA